MPFKLSEMSPAVVALFPSNRGSFLIAYFGMLWGAPAIWEKSRGFKNPSFLEIGKYDSTNMWWISERDWSPKSSRFLREVCLYNISLINLSGSGRRLNNCRRFLQVEILGGMLDSGVARWVKFQFLCFLKTRSINFFYLFSFLEKVKLSHIQE